jgi:hypothetical protein
MSSDGCRAMRLPAQADADSELTASDASQVRIHLGRFPHSGGIAADDSA